MIGIENIIKASRLTLILLVFLALSIIVACPAYAALACNACHSMPPLDSAAGDRQSASGAFRGNHQGHSSNSITSCVPCHGAAVSSYTADHSAPPAGSGSKPVIRLTSALNNYSIGHTPASYSRGTFFNQTSVPTNPLGTCSSVNCHFEKATPAWGTANFVSPTDCDKCHGAPPSAIDPGSHAKHALSYPGVTNCQKCHPNNTTFQHATSAGNRPLKISFAATPNNGSGAYSGALNDYLPSQTNTFGSCSATYCHSSGVSVSTGVIPANTSPAWGSTSLACNGCHGNNSYVDSRKAFPLYTTNRPTTKANSHKAHLAYSCDKCHYNTTTDGVTITNLTNHLNRAYNVNSGTGISFTYSFATGGGSCSTISCHFNGTATWGGTIACGGCHPFTNATMITGSHATHLAALTGPNGVVSTTVTCDTCHGTGAASGTHAGHGNGVVAFADGNTLATTNACDSCHSKDGPYDGVNDAVIGAKPSWSAGVYAGGSLKAGKERWCVTCHDSGTSLIRGRQAPDLAGDNSSYGFYSNGHGAAGTECGACHGLGMNHNFDGVKTFTVAANNYKQGYRLKDVGGLDPLTIPRTVAGCVYTPGDFRLCFSCHNEQALMNDSRSGGVFGCTTNPYKGAPAMTTQFRNMSPTGYNWGGSVPANVHWDHLVDVDKTMGKYWKPDGVGTSSSSCTLCHNPHGGSFSGTPASRMTHGDYQLIFGSDGAGDYGHLSGANWVNTARCSITGCHDSNKKYYRPSPYPKLDSLTVADSNPLDPAPAEAGYTNARAVTITIATSGNAPTQMIIAEDAAFSVNSTGWIAYAGTYSYTLTAGEGTKTVYSKLKNASGGSGISNATIVLDQTAPVVPTTTINSPNGSEQWDRGTTQAIIWNTGGITDANLKAGPVTIDYSTNSGASYPNTVASGVANSGTYSWPIPSSLTSTLTRTRLTVTDRAGNQAFDSSNADFTIRAVTPLLSGIAVADNNNADPSSADPGYTNSRTVAVTLTASNYPDQMMIAENAAFTTNSTGWIAFAGSYNYTMTAGDGSKTVYVKVQNGAGVSGTQSAAIILDTTAPAILATTLTAPNGNELWAQGSSRTVTWTGANITDTNLKASPISIDYSADGGTTWTGTASGIANSGSFVWNPIPPPASYTARVRLTATDKAGNQSSDSSNANFNISPPANYIVTTTADTGAGSLRQAITDLVTAGGNNAIWFDITSGLTNGVAVINVPTTYLPALSKSGITIDGGSQTVLAGNTNPNGPAVRIVGSSYYGTMVCFDVTASNVTIKGLQFSNCGTAAVRTNSANTVINGNQFGLASDSTGTNGLYYTTGNGNAVVLSSGSTNAMVGGSPGNFISCNAGMAISDTGSGNSIMNNTIGLLPSGALCANNGFSSGNDIIISPPNGTVSNCLIQGNTICGTSSAGILLGSYAEGCSIKGNRFGLWYNGSTWTAVGTSYPAIQLSTSSAGNNVVGGPIVASSDSVLNDSNVFSAPSSSPIIQLAGNIAAKPNKVYGNFIGTNPQQTQTFSGGIYGVQASSSYNIIGGAEAGEAGNVITKTVTNGVFVNSGSYVKISRNSFYNNGTSAAGSDDAIALAAGANGNTTRPAITAANTTTVTVSGVLSGETIEVYKSDYSGSGTQYGEGKTFIGSAVSGGTSVAVPVSGVSSGNWVTAIRIQANQNTSPFSSNVIVP